MRQEHLDVAYALAPVICHETAGTSGQRYQDYFCRVDFDGDRRANNNWDHTPDFMHNLVPEVYCTVLETESHYFALYSVFHPRDWKPLQGHENDMEHAQVVARKTAGGTVVEYVCSNAHHWNHVYYNADEVDLSGLATRDREALYDGPITLHEGRPVIYIQPGTGELVELIGQVGHGISGVVDRPGSRWKKATATYEFEKGQGLVAFAHETPSAPLDPMVMVHPDVRYRLIPTDETLWAWRAEIGEEALYASTVGRWEADSRSYGRSGTPSPQTRKDYFAEQGWATDLIHPAAFVGNEGVVNAAHPPFAFSLSVPWWRYLIACGRDPGWVALERRHNALIDQGINTVENFFDPAHTWYLRLGAPPASTFSTDYIEHPYLVGPSVAESAAPKAFGARAAVRSRTRSVAAKAPAKKRKGKAAAKGKGAANKVAGKKVAGKMKATAKRGSKGTPRSSRPQRARARAKVKGRRPSR